MIAKEWVSKKGLSFNLRTKITNVGGGWYGEVDLNQSLLEQDVIYQDETVNTIKFRPYFRQDIKLAYKINSKKITHEIAIDVVNIYDTENILKKTFAPDHPQGPVVDEFQLGRLPLFYYRIDF